MKKDRFLPRLIAEFSIVGVVLGLAEDVVSTGRRAGAKGEQNHGQRMSEQEKGIAQPKVQGATTLQQALGKRVVSCIGAGRLELNTIGIDWASRPQREHCSWDGNTVPEAGTIVCQILVAR